MGFYPVCPASDEYVLGAPLFKKAKINLENGNSIIINAPENSEENRYIGAMRVNGKKHEHNFLKHNILTKGVKIKYHMVSQPEKNRGIKEEDAPYSFSREK